jgi:hypothetical protein
VAALDNIGKHAPKGDNGEELCEIYNLGTGKGYSVYNYKINKKVSLGRRYLHCQFSKGFIVCLQSNGYFSEYSTILNLNRSKRWWLHLRRLQIKRLNYHMTESGIRFRHPHKKNIIHSLVARERSEATTRRFGNSLLRSVLGKCQIGMGKIKISPSNFHPVILLSEPISASKKCVGTPGIGAFKTPLDSNALMKLPKIRIEDSL